jgi:hypothetical protein
MQFASGVIYKGDFVDSNRHGFGIWKHPNGEIYKG